MTTGTIRPIERKSCPACKSRDFGIGSGEPVQSGGWYGNKRFAWGQYAGVHMVRLTGQRCGKCGHVHAVDPRWDRTD